MRRLWHPITTERLLPAAEWGVRSISGASLPGTELSKRLRSIDRGELDFSQSNLPQRPPPAGNASPEWVPSWLSSFLTGSKKVEKKEAGMSWHDLEQGATLTVEGYKQYCYQYRLSTPSPTPKIPPKFRAGSRMVQAYDNARVQYLRMTQHEKIGGFVTPSQALEIERDPVAALNNVPLLQQLAAQSGYNVPEAQDFIAQLVNLRGTALKLLKWKEMGRPLPDSYADVKLVTAEVTKMMKKAEQAKFVAQLAPSCPLGSKRQFFKGRNCPRTGLVWSQCCASQKRAASQPTGQQPIDAGRRK